MADGGLIDRPTAQVSGYPARVLGQFLRDAVRGRLGVFDRLPEGQRTEVLEAVRAIWLAGAAWAAEVDRTSEIGNAEVADVLTGAPLDQRINATEVAQMLGVSERQARNLGPVLGHKLGGRWVFDRADVLAEVGRRGAV